MKEKIGVMGATSPAGRKILNLLIGQGYEVIAFSRKTVVNKENSSVYWVNVTDIDVGHLVSEFGKIEKWITVSSIWVTEQYFSLLEKLGAKRIVAISSTSLFTKVTSSSSKEADTVSRLKNGENSLKVWAEKSKIAWSVVRPTLIYGKNNDRNLSEIVKVINKLHFFPLFGKAQGLRQPIYVDDVAAACVQALLSEKAHSKSYNISGAEVLPYHEMIRRVFIAMHKKPRLIHINLALFKLALVFIRLIPRYKGWNADMVQRMNIDMIFSHEEATQDFGFQPQPFVLKDVDVGLAQQSES